MILLTREYKSCDCKSSFLSVQILYFPNTLTISFRLLAVFNSKFSILSLNGLLVVYDAFDLISTWFAWISHRISRNCFFFSNIFPYFRNRPWLEFPFITRYLHWTAKAKHLKYLEHIAKSSTKCRAFSFRTGLLCKETQVILLQPCTTSFHRHFFNSTYPYIHLLLAKKDMRFSRSCL